jgi:hypothetical protein
MEIKTGEILRGFKEIMKVRELEREFRRKRGGGFAETRQMFVLTSERVWKFACFEEMQIVV